MTMAGRSELFRQSDERLMEHIAQGDKKAFGVLYDRYARLLYNYFYRMLWQDRERARDFTQDLFAKIAHQPERFQSGRSFKTWFYSVAHNMCKNEYAKQEVRTRAQKDLNHTATHQEQATAGMDIDREDFRKELSLALNELDEVKRTTFELRFFQELSILEISEAMACSEGTVKSRLFYTLKDLNRRLRVFEGLLGFLVYLILQ